MADVAPAVLITGATSGLGGYLARQLASSGWQVLAHGRDPARVADLCAELGGGAAPWTG
jgi:NADP-dependent 3-hydroxy acid dehydrogenase YdfG